MSDNTLVSVKTIMRRAAEDAGKILRSFGIRFFTVVYYNEYNDGDYDCFREATLNNIPCHLDQPWMQIAKEFDKLGF